MKDQFYRTGIYASIGRFFIPWVAMLMLTGTLFGAEPSLGDPPGEHPSPTSGDRMNDRMEREEIDSFKRLESLKIWKLTEELEVSEELAQKLFPRLREMEKLREKQQAEMRLAIRELDEAVKSNPQIEMKLKESIKKIQILRRGHLDELEKSHSRIMELLTTEQQAKFLLIEDEFPRKVRHFMKRHRFRGEEPESDDPFEPQPHDMP